VADQSPGKRILTRLDRDQRAQQASAFKEQYGRAETGLAKHENERGSAYNQSADSADEM
jgi:hypothetical protein